LPVRHAGGSAIREKLALVGRLLAAGKALAASHDQPSRSSREGAWALTEGFREEDVLAFIQAKLRSVWAVELLSLLKNHPEKEWPPEALVRELRSSEVVVSEALGNLRRERFIAEAGGGTVRYAPATDELNQMGHAVVKLFAAKPVSVVKAVLDAPNEKLRIFSEAFKLKDG
jgi:hypothetical protein